MIVRGQNERLSSTIIFYYARGQTRKTINYHEEFEHAQSEW